MSVQSFLNDAEVNSLIHEQLNDPVSILMPAGEQFDETLRVDDDISFQREGNRSGKVVSPLTVRVLDGPDHKLQECFNLLLPSRSGTVDEGLLVAGETGKNGVQCPGIHFLASLEEIQEVVNRINDRFTLPLSTVIAGADVGDETVTTMLPVSPLRILVGEREALNNTDELVDGGRAHLPESPLRVDTGVGNGPVDTLSIRWSQAVNHISNC